MANINLPQKKPGDKFSAKEVNEMTSAISLSLTQQRMATEEYFKLETIDENCIYVLTDANGFVDYLYLGSLLIAKRDKGNGSVGYPYEFPIIF